VSALGRYELLRPLARGGMADVFLARRRVAGVEKRLVIKRLRRDKNRDPRFLDMFVREAQLSMTLVQQNIVPVFDFGRIGNDVFLAMEHIDGKDLGSTLSRSPGDRAASTSDHGSPHAGVSPIVGAFIAAECCQALEHAHGRHEPVIHRDVTPRNILLSWGGEVKLADFGISAVVGDATHATFGTPNYMAPEQANGQACDARVDVYALGIVLWEAVTNTRVRPVGARHATLAAARSGDLPAIADTVPTALAAIIRRATAVDPADRFPGAHAMAEALDGFIVAERSRVGGQAPAKRLAEWLRTRWGDNRDDDIEGVDAIGADPIVTFLDDGEASVRGGDQTERSIAETAGDAAEPGRTGAIGDPLTTRVERATDPSTDPVISPSDRAVVERRAAPPSSRHWLIGAMLVVVVTAAIYVGRGRNDAAVTPPTLDGSVVELAPVPVVVGPPDAPPSVEPAVLPDAAIGLDAAIVRASIDAAPPVISRPPPSSAGGSAKATLPDAPVLRPITIGAIPWAYFTVDDDATQHETPLTMHLSVGTHRVSFSNPELGVRRTVTVTVPAEGDARHVEKMR
jgi:serine/threonine-protein kinase